MLFVNLMHETSPEFSGAERAAVHAWVERGGGLLAIAEHTNAYRSAEKVNPLLTPLGLKVEWTSALDQPEHCTAPPGLPPPPSQVEQTIAINKNPN